VTASFLVRLRVIHPVLALLAAYLSASVAFPAFHQHRTPALRRGALWVLGAITAAIPAGAATILLRAPVWAQLLHLLIADTLWICLVLFATEARTSATASTGTVTLPRESTLYARE
jgi:heme A synthase